MQNRAFGDEDTLCRTGPGSAQIDRIVLTPLPTDLELLRQKRAAELRRKLLESQSKQIEKATITPSAKQSPREIVRKSLVGRGVEVIETARRYYPSEIATLEVEIARLIEQGRLKGPITGEELYTFLRRAGLQFSLQTKIRIAEGGELKSIEEKLKGREAGPD